MKRLCWLVAVAALAGCSSREVVVVYSPHGPDVLSDYKERFEAAYPEVEVRGLFMGSQDVYARVSNERNRPQCDVWWGAPSTMFKQAASEDLLEAYRPSWADCAEVEHDAEDRWYATGQLPLAIVFNNRHYAQEDVPQTWDELLDPDWRGKITIRKPLPSGTMRTFLCAMIQRAPTEDEGLDWLRRLHASTEAYMGSPQELFDHVRKNPELVTVWLLTDMILERDRNKFPGDAVVPPQTPVITEAIGIVKGAPHGEWARKFYEFVTQPEELAHQAGAYAKMPARTDLPREALPGWVAERDIEAMPIDWDAFAANEKDWCARWEREVFSAQ
ncbi:MAG: extracellular solute-binding protein [bacterium]|nr:extracellular solute-binding protein [bacterium]